MDHICVITLRNTQSEMKTKRKP